MASIIKRIVIFSVAAVSLIHMGLFAQVLTDIPASRLDRFSAIDAGSDLRTVKPVREDYRNLLKDDSNAVQYPYAFLRRYAYALLPDTIGRSTTGLKEAVTDYLLTEPFGSRQDRTFHEFLFRPYKIDDIDYNIIPVKMPDDIYGPMEDGVLIYPKAGSDYFLIYEIFHYRTSCYRLSPEIRYLIFPRDTGEFRKHSFDPANIFKSDIQDTRILRLINNSPLRTNNSGHNLDASSEYTADLVPENMYYTDKGIAFVFQQGELGCMADGEVTIIVRWEYLKPYIKTDLYDSLVNGSRNMKMYDRPPFEYNDGSFNPANKSLSDGD